MLGGEKATPEFEFSALLYKKEIFHEFLQFLLIVLLNIHKQTDLITERMQKPNICI